MVKKDWIRPRLYILVALNLPWRRFVRGYKRRKNAMVVIRSTHTYIVPGDYHISIAAGTKE